MQTKRKHPSSDSWRPTGWELSVKAPLYNWRIVSMKGWGNTLPCSKRVLALLSLLWLTQRIGFCGRAAPDGSDVWDRKQRR